MAEPALVGGIPALDWSPKMGAFGEVVQGPEDVAQSIAILLSTPRGSSPLRPLFGCDAWMYLDKPLQVARPLILAGVVEAIRLWEPRATLKRALADTDGEGRIRLRLQVEAYGELLWLALPVWHPTAAGLDPGKGYVKPGYVTFGYVKGA